MPLFSKAASHDQLQGLDSIGKVRVRIAIESLALLGPR